MFNYVYQPAQKIRKVIAKKVLKFLKNNKHIFIALFLVLLFALASAANNGLN